MEITLRELGPARLQATLVIADERVRAAEEQAVRLLGSRVTIKGFRQGTAPLDRLREHLSPRAVEEETTQSIVREVLPTVLERSALHPIIPPRVELRAREPFMLVFTVVAKPPVTVDVRRLEKGLKQGKVPQAKEEAALLTSIASHTKVELAPELREAEVQALLEEHVRRLGRHGLALAEWLKQTGKTPEQFLKDLDAPAEERLRTRFGVTQLLEEWKITVSDEEIAAGIAALLAKLPEAERATLAPLYAKGTRPYEQYVFEQRVRKLFSRLRGEQEPLRTPLTDRKA